MRSGSSLSLKSSLISWLAFLSFLTGVVLFCTQKLPIYGILPLPTLLNAMSPLVSLSLSFCSLFTRLSCSPSSPLGSFFLVLLSPVDLKASSWPSCWQCSFCQLYVSVLALVSFLLLQNSDQCSKWWHNPPPSPSFWSLASLSLSRFLFQKARSDQRRHLLAYKFH